MMIIQIFMKWKIKEYNEDKQYFTRWVTNLSIFFINTIGKFWTIYILLNWKMIKLLKLTCSSLRSVYTLSLADRGRSVVYGMKVKSSRTCFSTER